MTRGIGAVWRKVKLPKHVDEIAKAIKNLA